MFRKVCESTEANDLRIVQHMHDEDINVDKFHDYCMRILNKTGLTGSKKHSVYFSTLYILELLGDELKNIAIHFINDFDKKPDLSNLVAVSKRIMDLFEMYYDLFYKFDREKVINFFNQDNKLYFQFPKMYKRTKNGQSGLSVNEIEVINHFRRILKFINALVELRIEMEF